MQTNGTCTCNCHKGKGFKGAAVFLVGLTFLLTNTGVLTMGAANVIWPIIVMLVGIKLMSRMCKCCDKPGM